MSHDSQPYDGKSPEDLTPPEWRAVMTWRMQQLERRVDFLSKSIVTLVITVGAGLLVYILSTVNRATTVADMLVAAAKGLVS